MKKPTLVGFCRRVFYVFLLLVLLLSSGSFLNSLIISEMELDPSGTDSGKEWIELYSSENIDMKGYIIKNKDGDILFPDFSFSGYYVYTFSKGWLDNSDEKVFIINFKNETIFETPIKNDGKNNDQTWQDCSGEWVFANSSKAKENNCEPENLPVSNPDKYEEDSAEKIDSEEQIELSLVLEENTFLNKEYDFFVKAKNLENLDYDLKVSILSGNMVISEIFDPSLDWRSGIYFLNNFMSSEQDKVEVKLRLAQKYANLSGNFLLKAKLRESSTKKTIAETSENIKIVKIILDRTEQELEKNQASAITGETSLNSEEEVIILGNLKPEVQKKVIFSSKTERIKEYLPYALLLICLSIIVIIFKKKEN